MANCCICGNQDYSLLRQLCCPAGLVACINCIFNARIKQNKCPLCNCKLSNKLQSIMSQFVNQRVGDQGQQNSNIMQDGQVSMSKGDMISTKKKLRKTKGEQTFENQLCQQSYQNNHYGNGGGFIQNQQNPYPPNMGFHPGYLPPMGHMNQMGNMQHMQQMPQMNFMPGMNMMPNYYTNWQQPNYYGYNQPIIPQQNLNQSYQQPKFHNPHIENQFQQNCYNNIMKSATRGISSFLRQDSSDDQQDIKPPRYSTGQYFHEKNQSKTTDYLQQTTTRNKSSTKINRSTSVNNLTYRK